MEYYTIQIPNPHRLLSKIMKRHAQNVKRQLTSRQVSHQANVMGSMCEISGVMLLPQTAIRPQNRSIPGGRMTSEIRTCSNFEDLKKIMNENKEIGSVSAWELLKRYANLSLKHSAGTDAILVKNLDQLVATNIPGFSSLQLCDVLMTFGSLEYCISPRLINSIEYFVSKKIDMTPPMMARLVYEFAALQVKPSQKFCAAIEEYIERNILISVSSELSMFLMSFAKFGYRPSDKILDMCLERIGGSIDELTSQCIGDALYVIRYFETPQGATIIAELEESISEFHLRYDDAALIKILGSLVMSPRYIPSSKMFEAVEKRLRQISCQQTPALRMRAKQAKLIYASMKSQNELMRG